MGMEWNGRNEFPKQEVRVPFIVLELRFIHFFRKAALNSDSWGRVGTVGHLARVLIGVVDNNHKSKTTWIYIYIYIYIYVHMDYILTLRKQV